MAKCLCGCGTDVKGNSYVKGHKPVRPPVVPVISNPVSVVPTPVSIPEIPTRRDREIELMKMELNQIDKYMGERHQNTTISQDERLIISLLRKNLALHPWNVSKRVCLDLGIPFDDKEFELDVLRDFLDDYIDFGLPLLREGRKETKDIFSAYFEGKQQQEEKPKRLIT